MKFGVRDICDVVFKAKTDMTIGTASFKQGQPVLYIDTATTSSLEQSTTTVYAQGGKGNTRLVSWEGEKTLTFNVTDALISPIGLAILSGAGLFKATDDTKVHIHSTATASVVNNAGTKTITINEVVDKTAPIFIVALDEYGDLTGTMINVSSSNPVVYYKADGTTTTSTESEMKITKITLDGNTTATACFVDFYVVKKSANVSEIDIKPESFGGNFYVEASTLFRDKDGKDHPAEMTFPNVKIQSNFTFSMAATGDPSTFDFVMDAMPDYTMFDKTTKVMCVIQTVDDASAGASSVQAKPVMLHSNSDLDSKPYQNPDSYDAEPASQGA